MILLPALLWMLLLLPGWAIARRWAPRELDGGLMPGMAAAWVAAFLALAPATILGYALHAPMWLAAISLAAFIAWGAADLVRTKAWRIAPGSLVAAIGIETILIAAVAAIAARHGSILGADARIHIARIRFLHDHGLSNLDPFVAVDSWYPIYHTNLHHALMAAGSTLLGIEPISMWFGSLAAAQLMIAAGAAYLAWAILGGRWPAWVAAVMVLVDRGPVTFSIYPNQLAPWFLLPVAAGLCIRMVAPTPADSPPSLRRIAMQLGGIGALIGMFHPLYAGFVAVTFAPTLAAIFALRLVRRRSGKVGMAAAAGVACLAIVAGALPFPLAGKLMSGPSGKREQHRAVEEATPPADDEDRPDGAGVAAEGEESPAPAAPAAPAANALVRKYPGYSLYQWGETQWIGRTPGRGFTGSARGVVPAWRVLVLAIGVALACLVGRRRQAFLLATAIVTVQAILLVPPLCTEAVRVLGSQWMIQRIETLGFILWIPLSAPALAACLERLAPFRWGVPGRWLQGAATLAAIPLALLNASHRSPYDWDFYLGRAWDSTQERLRREHDGLLRLQAGLRSAIPAGSVVLADAYTGTRVAMLHDVSLVASERSSLGVPDLRRRRDDAARMLAFDTDEDKRAKLFAEYHVTHYAARGSARGWTEYWAAERVHRAGHVLLRLDDRPDASQLWRRQLKLAIRAEQEGKYADAAKALERITAEVPGSTDVWFRLGLVRLVLGKVDDAASAFAKARDLDPTDPKCPLMLGNALFDAERWEEAKLAFEESVELALANDDEPSAASALFNLGNTLYRMDRLEDALIAYERALRLDPSHSKARTARGYVLEDLGLPQSPFEGGWPAAEDESAPSSNPTP